MISDYKNQYDDSKNLDARIALHQLYSLNKTGWMNWFFQQYNLKENQTILELGCGNGDLWKLNADKIPVGVNIVLTEKSPGMLDAAKQNTRGIAGIKYKAADAQEIHFCDDEFDIVIANHMLYHVTDIDKALGEIARVLKPDGVFYATANGKDNMKEIPGILSGFDPAVKSSIGTGVSAFGLENGEKTLREHFSNVKIIKRNDGLHITKPKPLIDYLLSSGGMDNVNEIITGGKVPEFEIYIQKLFEKTGYIDISKSAGVFISSSPVK